MAPPLRSQIEIGSRVSVNSQSDGSRIEGIVEALLTNHNRHTYGIMVQLADGQVGRVQSILSRSRQAVGNADGTEQPRNSSLLLSGNDSLFVSDNDGSLPSLGNIEPASASIQRPSRPNLSRRGTTSSGSKTIKSSPAAGRDETGIVKFGHFGPLPIHPATPKNTVNAVTIAKKRKIDLDADISEEEAKRLTQKLRKYEMKREVTRIEEKIKRRRDDLEKRLADERQEMQDRWQKKKAEETKLLEELEKEEKGKIARMRREYDDIWSGESVISLL